MSDITQKLSEKADHTASLPTWNQEGKRRWIYPQRQFGEQSQRRFKLSIFLILIYIFLPWVEHEGVAALRFNLMDNRLEVAFQMFRFTDIKYLIFVFATLGIGLFLVTSLRGRIWCGDYCPQTVFLDWLIRPIEEWLEGNFSRRKVQDSKPLTVVHAYKKFTKHALFFIIASILSHSLLGFFVSPYDVLSWIQNNPADHPVAFMIVSVTSLLLYIDFAYFREQFCSFLCPYARFQAIMIDANTPAIGYDYQRGEPRGRAKKRITADGQKPLGDCIDCNLCVRVCPTGIDIRNGNQLECIQCRRCEDACNEVMTSLKRPTGLIRMATENELSSRPQSKLRYRPIIYSSLLALVLIGFTTALFLRNEVSIHVTRQEGAPYALLDEGGFTNTFKLTIQNNTDSSVPLDFKLGFLGEENLENKSSKPLADRLSGKGDEGSLASREDVTDALPQETEILCPSCSVPLRPYETRRVPLVIKISHEAQKSFGGDKKITVVHDASSQSFLLPLILPK